MATSAFSLRTPLRQARLAQLLVLVWMLLEAAVAIGSGIAARSIALTAFGADSLIELFTAGVVLRQLLRRSEQGSDAAVRDGERRASGLVGWALYAVIGYILLSSAASLLLGVRPEASPLGIGLMVAAILVMAALWRWRLNLADRLGSPALKGDAACSAVCLYLAGTTLVGLVLNQLLGWWWADPVAALALIWWIRGEANEALEGAGIGSDDHDHAG
ncbi:MAG: cation transporter [Chloroflexi bacterium]|nr:MAG: cation transporter [Chloroflexota bacterium]